MYERVMEILVYLMQYMQDGQGRINDIAAVSQTLMSNGYTQEEVSTAFTWLFERLQSQTESVAEETVPPRSNSNRILHTIERLVISPEAYGYLIQLRELGLIDDIQTEVIIERAMLTGAHLISPEDMKTIAASILLETEGTIWSDGPSGTGSDHAGGLSFN